MKISAAGNTEVPAYLVLVAKGYKVLCVPSKNGPEDLWIAERSGNSFSASGPVELLGVVTIGETRGELWPATDEEIEAFLVKYDMA